MRRPDLFDTCESHEGTDSRDDSAGWDMAIGMQAEGAGTPHQTAAG